MKRKTMFGIVLILISIGLLSFAWHIQIGRAQGFVDDFSTDTWTHFSGDSTYDSYVDTSAGVLRFYSEGSDRDFSYRQIAPADNVTVEFKIRMTFTQNSGATLIGLVDAPDSVFRGWAYSTNTQPPSEVTRGIFLVIHGRDWTPRGNQIMFSGYQYDSGYENWTQDVSVNAGYDFDLDTDYCAKITKEGGRAIVELWDASKTTMLFQKDWGNIGLPVLQYLLVSDNYIGSNEGYGWTSADQVHGYIDDLRASTTASLSGDLNQDGIVDIFDAVQAGSAFGSYPGHPKWNSQADLNQDNIVDIFDLISLVGNFGKTTV